MKKEAVATETTTTFVDLPGWLFASHKVTPRGWLSRLLWRFIRYDIDKFTLEIATRDGTAISTGVDYEIRGKP